VQEISYIVVNGVRYPVEDGTTVNIDGHIYSVQDLLDIAQPIQSPSTSETDEPIVEPDPTTNNSEYPDVSYVVVNGDKYSIDDLQATSELQKLQASVANAYSNSKTYNVGDYCLYDSTLYECVANISEPEEWNESHWEKILLTDVTGVSDYNELQNKPSINNVTLQENTTLQQLGLQGIYYDTKANWDAQRTLVAQQGTIYIYKDYSHITEGNVTKDVPALKIGDGTSYLIDMPIANGDVAQMIIDHINNTVIHVTADDKTFWNNKSSAYIEPSTSETLVLSNTNFMLGGIIYNHG
jgi:hypothetical protein